MAVEAGTLTDISLKLPTLREALEVLSLQAGYNTASVMLGTTFLGAAAGIVGTFALLRKRALMGDAIAHSTLPGICVAFLLLTAFGLSGRNLPVLLAGGAASGLLSIAAVHFLSAQTRLTEDAAIGSVLSVFFGAGVVLLSVIQTLGTGTEGGLQDFIYGQTAAMRRSDAIALAAAALLTAVFALAMLKEFRIVCFDSAFARVQGWPTHLIDAAMMGLVIGVTVIGLQSVGMILIVALLIVPAAAARFWTERLDLMTIAAGCIGALSGYAGSATSALFPRMPAGAVIVAVCGVLFGLSLLLAPRRGVVAGTIRLVLLRFRVAREHLLRAIYEANETEEAGAGSPVSYDSIRRRLGAAPGWVTTALLSLQGLVRTGARSTLVLTPRGLKEAARVTRNHRLWEEYIVLYGQLAVSHVDYSADFVEHALSAEIVRQLEDVLRRDDRLPRHGAGGPSVHPLEDGPA